MTDFAALIQQLVDGEVDFIVVGGFAATVHGAARLTVDLDIVYARTEENFERLCDSLAELEPYPRGAPPGLPFKLETATLRNGMNFTLATKSGDLDLLGQITGGGGFEALRPSSSPIEVFGRVCLCLDLPKLIEVKRAAGRPKDFEAIAELELLVEESQE